MPRRSMPSEQELLGQNQGLMEMLIPGFQKQYSTHWRAELDDWKGKTDKQRAEEFLLRYGSAFHPSINKTVERVSSGGKKSFNEDNYFDQVVRNFIYGGGVDNAKPYRGQVQQAPYENYWSNPSGWGR